MSIYIAGINFIIRYKLSVIACKVVFYGMVCFGLGLSCEGRGTDIVTLFLLAHGALVSDHAIPYS